MNVVNGIEEFILVIETLNERKNVEKNFKKIKNKILKEVLF
jgi:hypothetical protein